MTLEDRVAALEQRANAGGDSFAPDSGQRIDAQGRVAYDFTGHIHAKGLDLDAGTLTNPPDENKVRWLRTDTGAVVAEIYGPSVDSAGIHSDSLQLRAHQTQNGSLVGISLQADDGATAGPLQDLAGLSLTIDPEKTLGRANSIDGSVRSSATDQLLTFKLLNENGASSFVQVAGGPAGIAQARGGIGVPPSFAGTRYATLAIAHGLADAPAAAYVSDTYAPSSDTSSGENEPVTSAIDWVDGTYINVLFILPPGITCAVGPGPVWWTAST